jgi:hypothetical protein
MLRVSMAMCGTRLTGRVGIEDPKIDTHPVLDDVAGALKDGREIMPLCTLHPAHEDGLRMLASFTDLRPYAPEHVESKRTVWGPQLAFRLERQTAG